MIRPFLQCIRNTVQAKKMFMIKALMAKLTAKRHINPCAIRQLDSAKSDHALACLYAVLHGELTSLSPLDHGIDHYMSIDHASHSIQCRSAINP